MYYLLGLNRCNFDRHTLFGRTFNSRLFSKWSQEAVTYFLFRRVLDVNSALTFLVPPDIRGDSVVDKSKSLKRPKK